MWSNLWATFYVLNLFSLYSYAHVISDSHKKIIKALKNNNLKNIYWKNLKFNVTL